MADEKVLNAEEEFCLQGCGSYKQYHRMRKGFEKGVCPFCEVDRTFNLIIWEDDYAQAWRVPDGIEATRPVETHLIVTPKRHVTSPWELFNAEVISMHEGKIILSKLYNLHGGGVITRFGDRRFNAGTVPHLHENIMVPSGQGEVRIPLFKTPEDRAKNIERAAIFASRYEAGEQP